LGTSRTLWREKYKAARVTKELDALLGEPPYAANAAAIGRQVQGEDGARAACDELEKMLAREA
ncbi:MAG: glycosyltransferase, partial [Pyrinomonadaceae bacterium]